MSDARTRRRHFVVCGVSTLSNYWCFPLLGTTMLDTHRVGILLLVAVRFCSINTVKINQNISVENILRKNILKNYDKVLIPNTRDSYLNVNMRMVIQNAELDYEKSQMIISTWFIANWNDDRLTWEPDEYERVNSIVLDHREIWHPDIMAYNNVDANIEDDRTRVNSVVNSTGSVIWVEPVQYKIHCQTDLTNWPHDKQSGFLKLGSWMYMGNVLNLTTDHDDVEVSASHSEWDIINVSKERHVTYYSCCPDEQYIDIEYNITIRRNVHPYPSTIYIPALCSASFNLITFWLPYTDNYCRLFANLFNALFAALNVLIVYSMVPVITSSIPLIVVYYTYSLGLIAATTVISTTVKDVSAVNRPLPREVTQFLRSGYLVYLGVETNDSTADCHVLCETEETNGRKTDLTDRRKLAKVIDRMCFVVFAFVYVILLLRYMP